MRFEVIQNDYTREWWARIVARNGRIVFTSEMYKRKQGALNALRALRGHFRVSGVSGTMVVYVRADGDEWEAVAQ